MVRMVTQILVGLMLLFGAMSLFPKAYIEFKTGRKGKSALSAFLGALALFFSCMAFYYAYLILKEIL
jgi:hypothetical protein